MNRLSLLQNSQCSANLPACRILSSQWNGHEMSSCQCLRPQTWLSSVNVLICLICCNCMYSNNWIYLADWPSPGSFVHPKQSRSSGHVPCSSCCSLFTWKCLASKNQRFTTLAATSVTTLTLLKKLYAWVSRSRKTNSAKSSKNRQGKLMQWCSLVASKQYLLVYLCLSGIWNQI